MPRNVEIKARVANLENLKERAKKLAGDEGTVIVQEDTFFCAPNGRLKLRNIKRETGMLIQYVRPDQEGPKLSNFHIVMVDDVDGMKTVLANAMGVKGVVRKTRLLVMLGQTRIHLDEVEGLGTFMELEVILTDDQTVEEGQTIAEDIMRSLNIDKSNLLDCAYMDMILKGK